MTILFISDLHLTVQRPRMLLQFYEFLDKQVPTADALYILGDLFEFWVGDDAAETTGNEPILLALRDTTSSLPAVYFLPGNRDFLVGQAFAEKTGVQILGQPSVIDLFGRRTLIMHGDSLCIDDQKHQEFRAMVDTPEWQSSFLDKPVDQRLHMAKQARMISEQNKQLTPMDIMDVNQEEVSRQMQHHDTRLLIHGHTHRPGIHRMTEGTDVRYRVVLGDWYEQSSVLSVNESGLSLTPGDVELRFDAFSG